MMCGGGAGGGRVAEGLVGREPGASGEYGQGVSRVSVYEAHARRLFKEWGGMDWGQSRLHIVG